MSENRVYISYRSSDSQIAQTIYDRAIQTHGHNNVVMNPEDSMPENMPVPQWVDSLVNGCHHILILIGTDWTGYNDYGVLKLSDGDMVFEEVLQALRSSRKVIPVLVNGRTHMPYHEDIPPKLHPLLDIPPIILRSNYPEDLDKLIPIPTPIQRLEYILSLHWLRRLLDL